MRSRVDVVLQALRLDVVRRRGTRAWIFCPFHAGDAKAPTFFVRTSGERRGNFHCFSCKASGDLTELVARVRGVERNEARDLIDVVLLGWEPQRRRLRVVERAPDLARRRFEMPPEVVLGRPLRAWVSLAREYLEDRGVGAEEVERYGLGYAVDGRLAARVVFPVRAAGGEAVGYSARTFADEEPRYLTPAETERADLDAMFGEHLWPPPGERRAVVVTEGAIDAISAGLASGLPHAALSGSELRAGHVLSLATFDVVVVLTDADKAGAKAARQLRAALARTKALARLALEGGDANEWLRRDRAALREKILGAVADVAS